MIESFVAINPACLKMYGNKTQRGSCKSLIDLYGFERVKGIISQVLPETNKQAYFPTITTPYELEMKWASLEAGIQKEKSKTINTKDIFYG